MAKPLPDMTAEFRLTSAVVISPGDTLVLVSSSPIAEVARERMAARLREHMPAVSVAFVEGFEQALVYHPEPSKGTP